MADPLACLSRSEQAQLRLVCWVAVVDGSFDPEERALLTNLAARLLPGVDPAEAVAALVAESPSDLDQLVAQLDSHGDRQALVKLAFQMVCSSQDAADQGPINAAERVAYRRLLEALDLSEAEVQEAEWAASEALRESPTLLDRLNQMLFGWGAWPSQDVLESAGTHWL